ncbi:MAG: DUF2059 domain-containing protein [Pseudolabrys sp.]
MTRLLRIVLLCGCLAVPARAQDAGSPQALQAAQELASIITGDTIVQMSSALTAQLWPRIESQFGSKVDAATMADLRTEFERTLASSTAEMMKDAPAIYARHFSAQELHDLLTFYKSPTGKKALQVMPTVMADVTTQMMPRMEAFEQKLNTRLEAVMQKHGYKN